MLRKRSLALIAVAFLLASVFLFSASRSVSAANTTTVTLIPTDNTFIDSSYPTINYASFTIMGALSYSGSLGVRTEQCWLMFDTSEIPSGATITSATLTLSLWYTAVNQNVGVYGESSNSWSASTITWDNAPLSSVSGTPVGSDFVTNSTLVYTWNVASIVANSVGRAATSMVLQPTSPQSTDVDGWSNFFTTVYGGSYVPILTVTYSVIPQVSVTLGYSVIGGGLGYSAPTLTYTSAGVQQTVTLTTTPQSYSMDLGSQWSVSQNLPGSSSTERWATVDQTTSTASAGYTETLDYYNQYALTLSYSIEGGGSPSPPTATYVSFGGNLEVQLSTSPQSVWADSDSFGSATNPLSGSTSTERWYSTNANGTISQSMSVDVVYTHQFTLTAVFLPPSCTQLSTCPQARSAFEWETAGVTDTENVSAVFDRSSGVGYRFTSYSVDGGSPQQFPLTLSPVPISFMMNSAHTVVLTTVYQYQVALDSNAASALSSITSPTISGDNYWYDSGTQVSLVLKGVWGRASGTGTRLASYKVNGGNTTLANSAGTVNVLSISSLASAQVVNATVVTQYQLSTSSGSIASATSPTVSGDTGWYDSGTPVTVTFNMVWDVVSHSSRLVATGYSVDGGTTTSVTQSTSGTFPVSVTMTSAHTISVQSETQYYVAFLVKNAAGSKTIVPSDLQILVGGQTLDVPSLSTFLNTGSSFTISKVTYGGLDVKPATATQYPVSSPSNVTVLARVYDATIKVTDLLGLPVSGAAVHMTLANGTTVTGTTGSDGTFTAQSVPLGTFSASVASLGSSSQLTGDASRQAVTPVSVLFSTVSLGVIVAVVIVVVGAAIFMLRRRGGGRHAAPKPKPSAPSTAVCPRCGAPVSPSLAFCESCGAKLK